MAAILPPKEGKGSSVISCSVKPKPNLNLSLYIPLSMPPPPAKSQSASQPRNLGDQSGFRGAVPNLVNHVIGPTTTGPTEGHGRNNEEVLEWRWLNKGLLGRRLMTLCVHNLARNGFGGVGNRSMGIPIGHAHLLLLYETEQINKVMLYFVYKDEVPIANSLMLMPKDNSTDFI